MAANKRRIEIPLDLSALYSALEQPLGLMPEEKRGEFQAYIAAARLHLERASYDYFSSVTTAIEGSELGLAARLEYRPGGPCLVFEQEAEPEPAEVPFVEGDVERVTIRLPSELKEMIDKFANGQGVSANSWYIRELARTIGRQMRDHTAPGNDRRPRGNRRGSLRGFVGDE